MDNKKYIYWTMYKKLEKEILNLTYFIQFTDEDIIKNNTIKVKSQLFTYSNQIADLLITCNIQMETIFKKIYEDEICKKFPSSTGEIINKVNKIYNLECKILKIIAPNFNFTKNLGDYFAPMGYSEEDENDYYSAYCAVKHDRFKNLYKANINTLIRALASLFILNIYYKFESYEVDMMSEIDLTLDSDIFLVKCSNNNKKDNETDKSIIVYEINKNYENQFNSYTDKIPTSMIKLHDYVSHAKCPRLYQVNLNKDSKD